MQYQLSCPGLYNFKCLYAFVCSLCLSIFFFLHLCCVFVNLCLYLIFSLSIGVCLSVVMFQLSFVWPLFVQTAVFWIQLPNQLRDVHVPRPVHRDIGFQTYTFPNQFIDHKQSGFFKMSPDLNRGEAQPHSGYQLGVTLARCVSVGWVDLPTQKVQHDL